MQRKYLFALLIPVITIFLLGCKEQKKRLDPLMADLDQTDSTEILYFRSPDSVRYFHYLPTTDPDFISDLIANLRQDTVPPITCMKEGKIYLFKRGAIFNTVFFGYLDKDCKFLRYIKNGNLFHYRLSQGLEARLIGYKSVAKEPVTGSDK